MWTNWWSAYVYRTPRSPPPKIQAEIAWIFGNTVGWDFQKNTLICKHSLNHKSTCDQSDCSIHSPTNTAFLCFIRAVRIFLHSTCTSLRSAGEAKAQCVVFGCLYNSFGVLIEKLLRRWAMGLKFRGLLERCQFGGPVAVLLSLALFGRRCHGVLLWARKD